jgi:hypothetical protein
MFSRMIKRFLCKTFNVRVESCLKESSEFNLVIKDTSTAIQRSLLECKKCSRTFGY